VGVGVGVDVDVDVDVGGSRPIIIGLLQTGGNTLALKVACTKATIVIVGSILVRLHD